MNIGCDIVDNKRLKNKNQKFIDHILTINEQKEFTNRNEEYLFGRFAAKEAIMKALPNTKELSFTDIEILTNSNGEPYCSNIKNVKVTISHEKDYTIAFAIII